MKREKMVFCITYVQSAAMKINMLSINHVIVANRKTKSIALSTQLQKKQNFLAFLSTIFKHKKINAGNYYSTLNIYTILGADHKTQCQKEGKLFPTA